MPAPPHTLLTERRALADERDAAIALLAYVGNADRAGADEARLIPLGPEGEAAIGRGEDLASRTGADGLRITCPDPRMSARHARLSGRGGAWTLADEGARNGTFVDGARVDQRELRGGEMIETGRSFWRFLHVPFSLWARLPEAGCERLGPTRTICPRLCADLADLTRVAGEALPILVTGETGTGKEVLARQVHEASGRQGPLRAINCGALPRDQAESELFGVGRDAFTGVRGRPGAIEAADGGTLLLDEIGDLPLDLQVKLLRVLEEGSVQRVGDPDPRRVSVRFLAATHHRLAGLVEAGRFRRDLYARLCGFSIALPPLRDRIEDFGILVAFALARAEERGGPRALSAAAWRRLISDPWRLNLRGLDHAIATASALARGADEIDVDHLRALPESAPPAADPAAPEDAGPEDDEARRAWLSGLLREHGGNVSAAARAAGLSRQHVHRLMKRDRIRSLKPR